MTHDRLLGLAVVVALGVGATWLAWRVRWPSILFLLLFGLAAGPGSLWLFDAKVFDPDALLGEALLPVISLSVAVILFDGGLNLRLSELKQIGGSLGSLLTVGVLLAWAMTTLLAGWILEFPWPLAWLLGAILVVTGPTVLLPLLRQIRLESRIAATLRWEGIINDATGAMLAVLIFEWIRSGQQGVTAVAALTLLKTLSIGAIGGATAAALLVLPLRRYWIPDFLQSPVALSLAALAYALSNLLQPESGLLTVTVMGICLANQPWTPVRHIVEFQENLGVLLIGVLFVLLAARPTPADFALLRWDDLWFLAALILLVRPAVVGLATIGSRLHRRERLYLALIAPRGIVAAALSAVLAAPLTGIFDAARALVPMVLLVIIGTIVFTTLVARPAAQLLQLSETHPEGVLIVGADPVARALSDALVRHDIHVLMIDTDAEQARTAQRAGLPAVSGSIQSAELTDRLDLQGIGRLLAMAPDDNANAMAVIRGMELFGRAEVYQLASRAERSDRARELVPPVDFRGRTLFNGATWPELYQRLNRGATIQAIEANEPLDEAQIRARYGDRAVPLIVITETGSAKICTTDGCPTARPGDRFLCLMDASTAI